MIQFPNIDLVFHNNPYDEEIDGVIWKDCCPNLMNTVDLSWVESWWEQWPSEWVKKGCWGEHDRLVHPNLFSILCLKYEVY